MQIPENDEPISHDNQMNANIAEPKTPTIEQNRSVNRWDTMNAKSPWQAFSARGSEMKV